MADKNLLDAVELLIDRKLPVTLAEGVILSITPSGALVKLGGSSQAQEANVVKGTDIQTGDYCILVRPQRSSRWIVLACYTAAIIGRVVAGGPNKAFELSPPNSPTSLEVIPGAILYSWDVPAQQPVVFEVQTNTDEIEAGATSVLTTRGAYAIIPSDVHLYCRVRSVSTDFEYSSWSEWLLCEPGEASASSATDLSNVLIECDEPICCDGEFVIVPED